MIPKKAHADCNNIEKYRLATDDDNDKVDGVDVYYDQISEVVYLAKVILEEMEEKDHGESS